MNIEIVSGENVLTFSPSSPLRILAGGMVGFDGGETHLSFEGNAGGMGASLMGCCFPEREMKIRFEIDAVSSEDEAEWMRWVQKAASPGEACVIRSERFGRWCQIEAFVTKVSFERDKVFERMEGEVCFSAPIPFFEAIDAVTGMISVGNLGSDVYNSGDVSCGVRVVIRAVGGTVVAPSVKLEERVIRITESLSDGDELVIDTRFGRKGVWINGVESFNFDGKSSFFSLTVGENRVSADADEGKEFMAVSYELKPLYFGI